MGWNSQVVLATQVIIEGTDSALFVYNGTPAAGNLIASIASASGTDPYGNAYSGGGLAVYGNGFTTFLGQVGGVPELQFQTGSGFEATAANIAGGVTGAGGSEQMQLLMSGPQGSTAGGEDWVQVYTISNRDDASGTAEGQLRYIDTTGVVSAPFRWNGNGISIINRTAPTSGSGAAQVYAVSTHLAYVASDGNSYDTGRLTQQTTGGQTINTGGAGGQTINGLSFAVGVGTYRISGLVKGTNGSTIATQAMGVNGSATATLVNVGIMFYSATANTFKGFGLVSALAARAGVSSNLAANEVWVGYFDGIVVVSVAGTLTITGSTVTSTSDTWTVNTGGFIDLMPVA
jgi:hypothetical protein